MMRKISVFMLINNRYHLREGKCPLVCLPYTKWWLVWHWEEKIHLHLDKWSSEHHILNTVYALELSWENWSSYLFEPLPEEMQLYCNMWYSWKEKKKCNEWAVSFAIVLMQQIRYNELSEVLLCIETLFIY